MVARNEAEPWNEERASGMKRRIPFFVIGISSCFVLPCFATGCHVDHLKIATAAMQPRNDTKMVGFAIKPTIFISEMFEIRLAGGTVLRHGMPCLWLKDCHVAALLAMTQIWSVLVWKTDVLHFLRLFFVRCCSAPFFKRSFRKSFRFQTFRSGNCSVFPQNPQDSSLRGGRVRPTRQSLTERFVVPERTMVARDETEPRNKESGRETMQQISCFL